MRHLKQKELRQISGGGPISDWVCEKTKDFIYWYEARSTNKVLEELEGYTDGSYSA